jgi:hypothetical protein
MTFANYLLENVFLPRLQERRVLVVFDPQKRYQEICQQLQNDKCRVVFTENRPISSRQEAMERWMEMGNDATFQSQMVVHCAEAPPVPLSEEHLAHPFAAYSAIGHTFPSTRAGDDLKQLCHRFLPGRTAEVEQLFAEGAPSFEVINSLVTGSNAVPRLTALFATSDAARIFLRFLVPTESHAKELDERTDWMSEFQQLCQRTLGLQIDPRTSRAETIRKRLWQYLLFSEFAADLPGKLPGALASVPRALGAHMILVNELCRSLRQDQKLKDAYREQANRVQQELELEKECAAFVDLGVLDTFGFEEKNFLRHAVVAFRADQLEKASEILQAHQSGIWTEEGERGLLWRILNLGLETLGAMRRAEEKLRQIGAGGLELCAAFENNLLDVDRFYRRLEEAAGQTVEAYHEIDDVVSRVRALYREYFNRLQTRFLKVVQLEGWPLKGMPFNTNTYDELVAPALKEGKRVVYFLVDALRLDLAQEIELALRSDCRLTLKTACAQLPCVTKFGMASLLPNAGSRLKMERVGSELEPLYDGKSVSMRSERMAVFKSLLNDRVYELNLATFIERSKTKTKLESLAAETKKADLLVLTSTELDELGEGSSTYPLKLIPSVVQQIQTAIRRCQELGFDVAVLATDHGFLWLEDTDSGSVCVKPPGEWTLVKRRCLIGKGDEEPGMLKFAPALLGIPTSEAAYVTPRALATFSKGTGYFHEGLSLQESLTPRLVVQFTRQKTKPPKSVAEVELSRKHATVTGRIVAVNISWPADDALGLSDTVVLFKLAAFQKGVEVGTPTSSEHVDSASSLIKIAPGKSIKVSVLLSEDITEGGFQMKAIAPDTEKVIHSLDLNYAPNI